MKALAARTAPVLVLALAMTLASLAPVLVGCGGNQRQNTLKAMLTTFNAARDGFEKWDETRQQQIIDTALSREAGRAALDDFRAKRDKVYALFEAGYRAIAAAALSKDEASLKTAQTIAEQIFAAIARVQGGP